MDPVTEMFNIDYIGMFMSIVAILVGLKSVTSLFEWAMDKMGLETKWSKNKRKEHELLVETSKSLSALQQRHIEDIQYVNSRDEEITKDIQRLTDMFLDKEIDDWRWKILDFSSALSNGRKYNRESFDHIIKIYSKYEKVLEENKLENGLVDESMKFVKKKYQERLDKGWD